MAWLLALALGWALTLAAPAAALPPPPPPPGVCPNHTTAPPADDAQLDTCDALDLLKGGDYLRGRHVLEMRAAKGDAFAVTGLGMMHHHGWGVPVDYDRAMGFYQAAADEGDLLALNQIGFMVLHGLGRTADPRAAWCWFEQAAEGGVEQSAHHLAELMAAGMQPASCKASGPKASGEADLRQRHGGVSGKALELWNGVREGMTPDQVASVLPAPYLVANLPPGPIGDHPATAFPASDVVLAPATLFGHPAIAHVVFDDHVAKLVSLEIDPQSDDPDQNLSLARALLSRFDAAYGVSFQVTDVQGAVSGAWRRGDLAIELDYMALQDQPPTFIVLYSRKAPADRGAPPTGPLIPAPGIGGT